MRVENSTTLCKWASSISAVTTASQSESRGLSPAWVWVNIGLRARAIWAVNIFDSDAFWANQRFCICYSFWSERTVREQQNSTFYDFDLISENIAPT